MNFRKHSYNIGFFYCQSQMGRFPAIVLKAKKGYYFCDMDKASKKEIQEIKTKILREKEKITDIKQLTHKEIDREFLPSIWELSEKELATFIAENLSSLAQLKDTRPDKKSVTSHRKMVGKIIVGIKRFFLKMGSAYSNVLLDKQIQFNQRVVELCQALSLRIGEFEKKISLMERRIQDCEENIVIVKDKKEGLRLSEDRPEDTGTENHQD